MAKRTQTPGKRSGKARSRTAAATGAPRPRSQSGHKPWLDVAAPATRALRIYTQDPSAGTYVGNLSTVHVPWEAVRPGPVGSKVAVVDYDASNRCYYTPIDLDHPFVLARDGVDPSESDPRFHQQMVYAVATRTIEMFEAALGRKIRWRRADRFSDKSNEQQWHKTDDIEVLHLYPHAMQEANAYYSPQAHGILFGYFTANTTRQGRNLPGQRVFTCLSHDIIAHEVTHAIIDGIRTYFTEATNPDVLAFHEGIADVAALFAHFTQRDALFETIRKTGGRLYQADLDADACGSDRSGHMIAAQRREVNPLIQLAQQFGEARGTGRGLRSALSTPPSPDDIEKKPTEPHTRGAILVAAVFDAFFSVYARKSADLFRIFHAGGGRPDQDEVPAPLAEQLARTATDLSQRFFRLCVRALDYCPPVDITFGDYLRALITVGTELHPEDPDRIRDALMQGFRLRGIFPESASFFSEDALRWPPMLPGMLPPIGARTIGDPQTGRSLVTGLVFGGPNGLTRREKDINGRVLRAYMKENAAALGLDPKLPVSVPSFHPMFRSGDDGRTRAEMVVEVVQLRRAPFDPAVTGVGEFPFRGGATVIISAPEVAPDSSGSLTAKDPEIRFVIGKPISGPGGVQRESAQRHFTLSLGLAQGHCDDARHFQVNFALLHGDG